MKTTALILLTLSVLLPGTLRSASNDALEARLQVLEDREAIRALLLNYGHYDDDRVCENGTWKFKLRTVTGDITRPVTLPGLDTPTP